MRTLLLLWALLPAGLAAVGGCAQVDPESGYTSADLHSGEIKTVHVKMFENQTFRRGIEFELTGALARQIELHTPYKVVANAGSADTVLSGSILGVGESVLTEQREIDRPLENQVVLLVEVTWKDLRSAELFLDRRLIKASGQYVVLLAAGRDSAAREAANEIAVRIVEQMESPW